jgi:hypothetical protein
MGERALAIDTLAYAEKLKAVGFTDEQAEVQTEMFAKIIDERLATKYDLKELEANLTIRLGTMMAASVAVVVASVKLL